MRVMEDCACADNMGEIDGMVGDDTDVSSEYEGDNTGLQSPKRRICRGKAMFTERRHWQTRYSRNS
jgi:hypothetical protein